MKLRYRLFRKRSGIFSFYFVDERCQAVVQNGSSHQNGIRETSPLLTIDARPGF